MSNLHPSWLKLKSFHSQNFKHCFHKTLYSICFSYWGNYNGSYTLTNCNSMIIKDNTWVGNNLTNCHMNVHFLYFQLTHAQQRTVEMADVWQQLMLPRAWWRQSVSVIQAFAVPTANHVSLCLSVGLSVCTYVVTGLLEAERPDGGRVYLWSRLLRYQLPTMWVSVCLSVCLSVLM